jgi:hypothetical protein
MCDQVRNYGRWAKDSCDNCGEEFQVTRTNPKVVLAGEDILCNDCDIWKRGYDQCLSHTKTDNDELKDLIEEMVEVLVDMWLDPSIMMSHIVNSEDIARYHDFAKKLKENK